MKNRIKRIVFILALIISVLAIEKVMKVKSYNGINQKEALYAQPKDSIDVLFMGTSHVHCGINTAVLWEEFGIAGYAYSGAEEPLWMTYYYLIEALKYQTPKMVVLDLYAPARFKSDYQYDWVQENIQGMRFSKNKLEMVADSVEPERLLDFYPDFFMYRDRYANIKKDDFEYLFGEKEILEAFKGYTPYFGAREASPPEVYSEDRKGMTEKSEEYLRKIIELTKEKNIQLMLIVVPYIIISEDLSTYHHAQDIASENDLIFINYNEYVGDIGLDYSQDFYDESHLNHQGSSKFTRYLGGFLSGSGIPDRRGEEGYESWDEGIKVVENFVNTGVSLSDVVH